MGRFVNPDNSAFQVALNSKIYVDKTGLIEYTNSVLDTTDAYICNSRPRRFGKSYAANMLAAYYSKGADSEKIDTYQDQNLYALDRENWRRLYKKIKEHGDLSKELAVQFLPVALKTNYLDDELKQIISPVYEMLKNNTIDFEQWNKIQVLLPEVEAYQSWDRCLRVRIALKNKGCSETV